MLASAARWVFRTGLSISPYLREITASRFWKIVFSFSAEFLKSSGPNHERKREGCCCHMFKREPRVGCSVLSVGWWVEELLERGSAKGNQCSVGGVCGSVSPISALRFCAHTQICISEYCTVCSVSVVHLGYIIRGFHRRNLQSEAEVVFLIENIRHYNKYHFDKPLVKLTLNSNKSIQLNKKCQ